MDTLTDTPSRGALDLREAVWSLVASAEEKLDRVLDQVTNLRIGQERIEGKVTSGLIRLDAHDTRLVDFETRVRTLESWRWQMIGSAAGISALVGTAASLLTWLVTR